MTEEELRARIELVRDLIARHTEVESDEVQFRHPDRGTWFDVIDALDAALGDYDFVWELLSTNG